MLVVSVKLTAIAGPHLGREISFSCHDTYLFGRSPDAHFQFSHDDPYFSRLHFLVEVNPPRCRLLDLGSQNGTCVNGRRVTSAELRDGDEIRAGHTVFRVQVEPPGEALAQPASPTGEETVDEERAYPVVPGHTIEAEVGRGGMGVVYRARCAADNSLVAVKIIAPAVGARPKSVERFIREAQILSGLSHPHIVAFRGYGEQDGLLYLITEYVAGTDAARLLDHRSALPVRMAVRMMYQVLKGLAYAHAKGFVHRDIKPSNILIAENPTRRVAKLADFGLARAFDASQLSGVTLQGEVSGTVAYMAPEQVTHFRDVQPPADQYSAAATLYRLLTNRGPHVLPRNLPDQLSHILNYDAIPVRERRSEVPLGLANVLHRALSRDPAERYESVIAFREALAPYARL